MLFSILALLFLIEGIILTTIFFSTIKSNILSLFLFFEIIYILLLFLVLIGFLIPGTTLNLFIIHYFFILIAISTSKTVIGLCILVNYIRTYNTIFLK